MDNKPKDILVTGGAGFIGSHLVRSLLMQGQRVHLIDAMTYAAQPSLLEEFRLNKNFSFSQTDIRDGTTVKATFEEFNPQQVFHLAAESHVDRSIASADDFITTNINGTYNMLAGFRFCHERSRENRRFIHVSTDEVYGALKADDPSFTEQSPYEPNSPYSASKAASDHLARAWHRTYGLPIVVTHCSNNYGPHQHPEKLIPVVIRSALDGKPIPVYGKGLNVRDWIYVQDHVQALLQVAEKSQDGQVYNIGGDNEIANIHLVEKICGILDRLSPRADGKQYSRQIQFVEDRLGHDFRYAIDNSKIEKEIGWSPVTHFEQGLETTIRWYMGSMK